MKRHSLTKSILRTRFLKTGILENHEGSIYKCFEMELLPSGPLEENLAGPSSDSFFLKLSELLTRLPDSFSGQAILFRDKRGEDFKTTLLLFEKVKKEESYSHIHSLTLELGLDAVPMLEATWNKYLSMIFGKKIESNSLPDIIWEKDALFVDHSSLKVLSLTELPQLTWNGCFQQIFESQTPYTLSLKFEIPDRKKSKRQLETKRKVSHALSVTSAVELRNIESNSVLSSSEETLERILVNKETLFEISLAVTILGPSEKANEIAHAFERIVSGIGNAGIYSEGYGSLPVLKSHIPGEPLLGVRKLPILSANLAEVFPVIHDYTRVHEATSLQLRSRTGEKSHLNLFSSKNLNFNSFICGASGSGKSFLTNAILLSLLKDEPKTRLCIFDIGGSYRRIVRANGGLCKSLTVEESQGLLSSLLRTYDPEFSTLYSTLIETLCGSGEHITHSHRVAINELLEEFKGKPILICKLINLASKREERFYQEIAHWLTAHRNLDDVRPTDRAEIFETQVTAFDFKELESNPVLQKATILVLCKLIWKDLLVGKYPRTLIVFDEVWRFFAESKSFLEEMYRTLRKYRAGILSITQNLADYGDDAFAKMIFTTSFTRIFLQNGANAQYLKETFDLSPSDIERALSVVSEKPHYSEFYALSALMSQVFRLYPTPEFYELANTENISKE